MIEVKKEEIVEKDDKIPSTIMEKIEDNPYLKSSFRQLLERIDWALEKGVTNYQITKFIGSLENEIKMRYTHYKMYNKLFIEPGQVVRCTFGKHVDGELDGKIPCIVCKKREGNMVFVVPLILAKHTDPYLVIKEENMICCEYDYSGWSVLTWKGHFINSKRIKEIVGYVEPNFLKEVLRQISLDFDFGHVLFDSVENNVLQFENRDFTGSANAKAEETIEKKEIKTALKLTWTEKALMEFTGSAWEIILNTAEEPEKKLEKFLTEIGIPDSEDRIVKKSFVIACCLDKITYPNLVAKLKKFHYQNENENDLQKNLKRRFNKWLEENPELKEESPRVSFTDLLGLFKKIWIN